MTDLAQLGGLTVPHSDYVLRKKRYDEIFAITADRYLPPKGHRALLEGLDCIKRWHLPLTH